MRILVLTHEFPPIGGGGGQVALDLAQGLARRGHEVRVLTAYLDGLRREEVLGGVRVERIPASRQQAFRAEFVEMARYDWAALWRSRTIVRAWKPDLIHAHFAVPAGAAAYALQKLTGVPYVLTVHLGDVPGGVPEKTDRWFQWVRPLTPLIWRKAASVIAVSQFTCALAHKQYDVPIQVIPNGVSLAALPARTPAPEGVPRLIFAGRFVEQKNPEHLVRALVRLKDLPWNCAMLGNGPLLERVSAEIREAGLSERFTLPGWVTPDHVLDWFTRSDILVLPSRAEGLSVVGVQALGMGLALVLSAAGGNRELVQQGENGFLFATGDVDALTEALRALLSDPRKLQAASERSRALSRAFDQDAITARYEAAFRSVLEKE